jgi:hypothetical protein
VSANAVALAPVTAIWIHGPLTAGARSISKPSSSPELSTHERSIRLDERATAERLLGSAGSAEAVGVEVTVG